MSGWAKRNFLFLDFIISVSLFGVLVSFNYSDNFNFLMDQLKGNRASIYSAIATTLGGLFGFIVTGISILMIAISDKKLWPIRESEHYPQLWKTFFISSGVLGLGTLFSLMALFFDKDRTDSISYSCSPILFHLILFFAIYSTISVAECLKRLWQIVSLVAMKQE